MKSEKKKIGEKIFRLRRADIITTFELEGEIWILK